MGYGFDKAKLPKGTSYPLRRSVLDAELDRAQVKDVFQVYYLKSQRNKEVMRASYHGDHRRDYYASGKTSISVYSVPSDERADVESALLNGGLAAIGAWLAKCENAQNVWRASDHHLILEYSMHSLKHIET